MDSSSAIEDRKRRQIEEKEKIAAIINTYQRNLQISEKKNAKLQQEYIDLQIQINELLSKQAKRVNDQSSIAVVGKSNSNNAALPPSSAVGDSPETESLIPEIILTNPNPNNSDNNPLYVNLTKEIQELKNLLLHNEVFTQKNKSSEVQGEKGVSRKPSSQLVEVLKEVMSGRNSGRQTPQRPSSGKESSESLPAISALQSRPLSAKMKSIESNQQQPAPSVQHDTFYFKNQLLVAEEKLVHMTSKQTALEEELKAYQNYMKEIIPQYQKQIKALQLKQKQSLKGNNSNNPAVLESKEAGDALLPSQTREGVKLPILKLP
jgi:hypothetical protein